MFSKKPAVSRTTSPMPSGWVHQGNVWMHATTMCSVIIVDGKVKGGIQATPATVVDLGDLGEALMQLGRWLEQGGRP